MRLRIITGFCLLAASLAGCSSTPPLKAEPVDVTVVVTLPSGQPGKDLSLLMLPTGSGQMQGGGRTDATGKLKAKLTPGKYTFAFDNPPTTVPAKYQSNNEAHTVEVPPTGGEITIKLSN